MYIILESTKDKGNVSFNISNFEQNQISFEVGGSKRLASANFLENVFTFLLIHVDCKICRCALGFHLFFAVEIFSGQLFHIVC